MTPLEPATSNELLREVFRLASNRFGNPENTLTQILLAVTAYADNFYIELDEDECRACGKKFTGTENHYYCSKECEEDIPF